MNHHHVDSDFDSLGYSYANDNRSHAARLIQGCQKLWGEVLEMAFRDRNLDRYARSKDFEMVCEFAGVEPSLMRHAAMQLVSGEMRLAPRQNANVRYEEMQA